MMNKVVLLGKISREPNLEYTPTGTAVCTLSVETEDEFFRDKVKQFVKHWSRVVCFGNLAEQCHRELKIDSNVYVEGSLYTRSWDHNNHKKYITEVRSKDIQFLDSKPAAHAPGPMDPEFYTTDNVKWDDDEIRF